MTLIPSKEPDHPKKHGFYFLVNSFVTMGSTPVIFLPLYAANHVVGIWDVFKPIKLLVEQDHLKAIRHVEHLITIVWMLTHKRLNLKTLKLQQLQRTITGSGDITGYWSIEISNLILRTFFSERGIPRRLYHLFEALVNPEQNYSPEAISQHLRNKLMAYNEPVAAYFKGLTPKQKTFLLLIGALGICVNPDQTVFPSQISNTSPTFNHMQEEGRLFPFKTAEVNKVWYFIPPGLLYALRVSYFICFF